MIERYNVSESLSNIADFSELDCKSIDTVLIPGKTAAEIFDEFWGSFYFFCSSYTLDDENPLVKKFKTYNKHM